MSGAIQTTIGKWHGGHTAVTAGVLTAVILFVQQLAATDASFYSATVKALGAGLLALAIASVGKQVLKGADIKSMGTPIANVGLGDEAAKATEESLEGLNQRMTSQMEDINKRLYDLETSVFKDRGEEVD